MSDPTLVPPSTVVLVSGGSRGLGLAVVTDLIDSGVKVAAFARTVTPELTALAEKYPDQLHVGSVDINDAKAGQDFVKEVEGKLGPIDGIVNNAAVGQDSLHVHTSAEQIANIIQTNLTAPLVLTRFVLRRMMAKGLKGRIVNITSICAQRGFPGLVAYSATKGGMDSATRSLARELGGRVLANAVAPGFFASEMSAVLGQTQLEQIVRRTPTGHLTEPDEVVPVVRMLLLDNTNINGQVLVIDGAASIDLLAAAESYLRVGSVAEMADAVTRSHLADFRCVGWYGEPPVGWTVVIDAEYADQPVPAPLARRFGTESFWPRWTRAECLCKLADVPMLAWWPEHGLDVPADFRGDWRTLEFGPLVVSVALAPTSG